MLRRQGRDIRGTGREDSGLTRQKETVWVPGGGGRSKSLSTESFEQANGPGDCLVTEMLRELSMETVYETTHWFEKIFREQRRAPVAWRVLRFVFLKKPDAKLVFFNLVSATNAA